MKEQIRIFSWYESDYDRQGEADVSSLEGRADFYFCKWPVEMRSVSEYFLNLAVIHVFGHGHIDFDRVIEGVRYVQHAFDYPREKGWSKGPLKQIWGSAAQAEADRRRE